MQEDNPVEPPPLIVRDKEGIATITEAGHELLSNCVTDTRGQVYAFFESVPSDVAGSAMARLAKCGDDVRVILLNEFASSLPRWKPTRNFGKELPFLRKIITDYGDDSVQQLASFSVVVMGASNILTKILERGRLGAYLEQSTRFIFFDKMIIIGYNADGSPIFAYRFYVPEELVGQSRDDYIAEMNKLFQNYSAVVHELHLKLMAASSEPEEKRDLAWRNAVRGQACDSARFLLPAATTSTVGLHGSAQFFDSLIMHMLSHELAEARRVGSDMLRELRKIAPVFFERTEMPERGAATSLYLRETKDNFKKVCNRICKPHESQKTAVVLSDYHPTNQSQLIRSLPFISGLVAPDNLTDEQESELLNAYSGTRMNRRHRLGRMIEKAYYTFCMRTGYAEFRDLQRHRLVSALEWLALRGGDDYDVPAPIVLHGLETKFRESFKQSSLTEEWLHYDNGPLVAQYATLFGHKMDWTWTVNLRELMHIVELRTQPAGHPAYRKLCQQMYEAVEAVHPKLAATISFINKGEDPELTRLAAERAVAFKQSKLQ